eukprot:NODE_20861_length_779_cov_2.280675.p4 GENE.NODE_20861_length_779_cov_2.280675~~NODE_20861_length_779_cov_2.280675.p4  ORF type:complete len:81 (+),score=9.78 NODE_20861_length_779_cov_2.280675:346-588(+)
MRECFAGARSHRRLQCERQGKSTECFARRARVSGARARASGSASQTCARASGAVDGPRGGAAWGRAPASAVEYSNNDGVR